MAEGGDIPVINLKDIVPQLCCLLCNEPLLSLTRLCEGGHTFCINCQPRLKYCTECSGRFLTGTRNHSIEGIANMVKYKCVNYDTGCRTLLTRDLILKHNATCPTRPIICLLRNIPRVQCTWTGPLHDILDHVSTSHNDNITSRNYFKSGALKDTYSLTIYEGEIFVYYKYIKDSVWYAAVMKLGLTRKLFKVIFVLKSSDPKRKEAIEIGMGVEVVDHMKEIFDSGRCLMLDDVLVKRFTANREMNMSVSIHEFRLA